jgi:MOSC domain-containing protein YiiM
MHKINLGSVKNLFFSLKGMPRVNPDKIFLDKQGVVKDKFYARELNRSVLIASQESYTLAKSNGIDMQNGALGENILIDINPYFLTIGSKIEIGEVILEITQNCTICNSLAKIDKDLPNILKSDRGIFAKTLKGGNIRKGDAVKF